MGGWQTKKDCHTRIQGLEEEVFIMHEKVEMLRIKSALLVPHIQLGEQPGSD